ncbi:2-C-methyl-D-erythritol 2,4-cyclodiphosphate synthase [Scrofimicrobium canadense]|uniref:2-C-methyl-D-erythritol 2,4-cyclodiphosphate synthase n=1 Tax=Scrofimicrobium canadense TaxID=2652290 RepID=UPI00298D6386|nr:2-C-methyl-D-erythritol 2,4-cyclodiphosphate synthase [Scrofimicrobium canadense]
MLSHAIIDAIAGAMADGDLGTHYPEDDPASENARSLNFVTEFSGYMRAQGYEIVNIDAFVTLGTTRLRPYMSAIREAVAAALDVPLDRISIKGRSHDGIAEVGRGQACSATATVLLMKTD